MRRPATKSAIHHRRAGPHRALTAIILGIVATGGALAQGYPMRSVRLVVPFPPGSPSDVLGRMVGQHYAQALGQSFVIDNRPGAAGVIGAETVAKAAPDGYTLLMGGTGALAINPGLRSMMPYDPPRDFAPVSLFARIPFILVVTPSLPVTTVKELIAVAKARPRQLNYASAGIGAPTQLAAELFKSLTGIDMVHVAYKGSALAALDLISGATHVMFSGITVLMPHVVSGKLRGVAIAAATRSPLLPQLPTVSESGVPGFAADTWTGVLAPRGTPQPIVTRLHQEIVRMVREPEVQERLLALGAEPIGNSPDEFRTYLAAEIAKWTRVIKSVGIKAE